MLLSDLAAEDLRWRRRFELERCSRKWSTVGVFLRPFYVHPKQQFFVAVPNALVLKGMHDSRTDHNSFSGFFFSCAKRKNQLGPQNLPLEFNLPFLYIVQYKNEIFYEKIVTQGKYVGFKEKWRQKRGFKPANYMYHGFDFDAILYLFHVDKKRYSTKSWTPWTLRTCRRRRSTPASRTRWTLPVRMRSFSRPTSGPSRSPLCCTTPRISTMELPGLRRNCCSCGECFVL